MGCLRFTALWCVEVRDIINGGMMYLSVSAFFAFWGVFWLLLESIGIVSAGEAWLKL